ncbi:lipopolysaccharide assembly protein LapB [Wenzhouxiangella sp. XN79A]|uniref:lipopolysaccharide assembly protein LapB n=1 Tax=Wenzhouxiangella sp. XN79A TaxID=2724193 RepID=UPI00144AEF78|nr:lipopolysaccharide assembly protein LapB [Wenzhouxiangella sp. XN79A]NKI35528.1 lipopolysaccharide assembly protein LapB [Wenzhouxiangella sp. XN79A]
MSELTWAALALLPVAAGCGWWLARRQLGRGERRQRSDLSSNYFRGLNYLLNEQPDKAIEVFLRLAEINTETVETHLALGNLFRRRGETDKAIRFHRHIMSRPQLSEQHRTQALLELGEDYMRAGLLDRAEKLYSELAEQGRFSETAVRNLLAIYQQEKDWPRAIVQARTLARVTGESSDALIAQFHCELAEAAREDGDRDTAISQLASARGYVRDCARAALIEARLAFDEGRFDDAIRADRAACERDPELIALVLDRLIETHRRRDRVDELRAWLAQLSERTPIIAPLLGLARLDVERDPGRVIEILLERLEQRPSVRGLQYLVDLLNQHGHRLDAIEPDLLTRLMDRLMQGQPRFRCEQCGFSGSTWHWQCPSCRQWETTRPVSGVLGE